MIRKTIKTGVEARLALAKGAKFLADAVGSTIGPWGENFFLEKGGRITNDGVTIAREISLPDEIENRGAHAIREAAIKTVEAVGDGTSTSILLSWKIYEAASRFLSKEGVIGQKTASEIVKQIEDERVEVTDKL